MNCQVCGGVVIGGYCQYCGSEMNPAFHTKGDVLGVAILGIVAGGAVMLKGRTPDHKAIGGLIAGASIGGLISQAFRTASSKEYQIQGGN